MVVLGYRCGGAPSLCACDAAMGALSQGIALEQRGDGTAAFGVFQVLFHLALVCCASKREARLCARRARVWRGAASVNTRGGFPGVCALTYGAWAGHAGAADATAAPKQGALPSPRYVCPTSPGSSARTRGQMHVSAAPRGPIVPLHKAHNTHDNSPVRCPRQASEA